MQYITNSERQTRELAEKLANKMSLHPKGAKLNIIALTGKLGAGKTIFAQGFAKGLGIKEKIISPSFILQRVHKIPNTDKFFYHIDLYRLGKEEDLKKLGLEDLFTSSKNIVLIEWAEKAKVFLPKQSTFINFEILDEHKRKIKIS